MKDKSSRKIIQGFKEKEDRSFNRGSEFAENPDIFCVDNGSQKVIAKFSDQDSSLIASSVDLFQLDQQLPIDFLRAAADNEESLYSSSKPLVTSFIAGVDPFPLHGELVQSFYIYSSLSSDSDSNSPQIYSRSHSSVFSQFSSRKYQRIPLFLLPRLS